MIAEIFSSKCSRTGGSAEASTTRVEQRVVYPMRRFGGKQNPLSRSWWSAFGEEKGEQILKILFGYYI
jgi:hypothetical protein